MSVWNGDNFCALLVAFVVAMGIGLIVYNLEAMQIIDLVDHIP